MRSVTVNISFNDELLKELDQLAREELRSRSELIREATRAYITKKRKWNAIFSIGSAVAESKKISESAVEKEIDAYRQETIKK